MNAKIVEEIRINSAKIVSSSISDYERSFGGFKISAVKNNFTDLGLELVLKLTDNLSVTDTERSIVQFKKVLLSILFELQFDQVMITDLFDSIESRLVNFVKSLQGYNVNILNLISEYFEQFRARIGDYSFYASSSAVDILRSQPEYQISNKQDTVTLREYDEIESKAYTIFPKERYWEEYKKLAPYTSYSPFLTDRIRLKLGKDYEDVDRIYEDLIIYEGTLYKLKPGVESVNRSYFDPEQWFEYSPKRFDKSKSFKTVYLDRIKSIFGKFSEAGFPINEIISDSKVSEFSEDTYIDSQLLNSTFGGYGNQIFYSLKDLKYTIQAFGGYQGSLVGGVNYIVSILEHSLVSSLGKTPSGVFDRIGDNFLFGDFDALYSTPALQGSVPGLKFLESFNKLRSFSHNQKVSKEFYVESSNKIIYNAVYSRFSRGLSNRFEKFFNRSSYEEAPNFDILLYAIQGLYRRCLLIGDSVRTIYGSLDVHGKVRGYEGLSSVEPQIYELRNIFPSERELLENFSDSEIKPGLTGAVEFLLKSYSNFSEVFDVPVFPGKSLEFFAPWIEKISNQIDKVTATLAELGLGTSSYIPNLSFEYFESKDSRLVDFMRSLGFRDNEISNLLDVRSFPELIAKFAPLSDSSDLKSFFKAFELCQLIYEFGGQEGIDAYLKYLFTNNQLEALLNILNISQKDPSDITYWNMSRYPKLIGLLIGLTYAIDPTQLIKFNDILGQNNLTLLESISFLFQKGETTIIKSPQDVELLTPMVQQMISGVYKQDVFSSPSSDYEMASTTTPVALAQWTKILEDNMGNIPSVDIVHKLYDRASGLTPKELISVLGGLASSNTFGALVDGFDGGNFTSFLKYANISGLGVKLGFYKNSYQVNNFYVTDNARSFIFSDLITSLQSINESLAAIRTVFDALLDYTFELNSEFSNSLEPLVLAQNKTYEIIPEVISSLSSEASVGEVARIASEAQIAESPGTGNSRVPNRVPVTNSVTSEQVKLLFGGNSSVSQLVSEAALPGNLVNTFIKFSGANTFINGVTVTDETERVRESRVVMKDPKRSSDFQIVSRVQRVQSKPYVVPKMYLENNSGKELTSSVLGANYLTERNPLTELNISPSIKLTAFNPVESCRRFGGTNCEEIYSGSQEVCRNLYNKALFPESYTQVPGLPQTSVAVDRPLGTFADYKPLRTVIPTSSQSSPASFYELLPQSAIIGEKGEPILSSINVEPLVPDSGGAEISEYANTEFGLVEFIRARLERNDEFNCSFFESPFQYQMCMNIMKCKRFSAPYNDEYFLDFCPRTLSGGRLK